jgi:hypothetical protein
MEDTSRKFTTAEARIPSNCSEPGFSRRQVMQTSQQSLPTPPMPALLLQTPLAELDERGTIPQSVSLLSDGWLTARMGDKEEEDDDELEEEEEDEDEE